MLNSLETNLRYLRRVTDDGRLALGTKERREQEDYFERHHGANEDEDDNAANRRKTCNQMQKQ